MKKRINCLPLVIMFIVMTMTSCSSTPDYVKMIPDDAVAIMRFDVKQIAEKSGSENGQMKEKMLALLNDGDMPAAARDKIKQIIDDPMEAGIDLRMPLLLSVSPAGKGTPDFAMLGVVDDADKLTELLNSVAENESEKVKTKGDIAYVYEDENIFAFNDNTFCLKPVKGKGESEAAGEMTRLLGGEMNYTIGESDFVKKLLAADGVMQFLVNGEIYEAMPEYKSMMKQSLPEGADLKDVACLFDLSMDKGEATLKYEVLTASDVWKKAVEECDEVYKPISGDLLEYISADGMAFVLNCDGEGLFSYMDERGFAKIVGESNMQQAKSLITTVNGDIAFDLHDADMSAGIPTMALYARTKTSAIADVLDPLARGMARVGYKDGTTYCLTGSGNEPFAAPANAMRKNDAKGKRMYFLFNFDMLQELAKVGNGQNAMIMATAAQVLEKAELTYEGDGKGEMRIAMRDKDKNPLEAITELVTNNLN